MGNPIPAEPRRFGSRSLKTGWRLKTGSRRKKGEKKLYKNRSFGAHEEATFLLAQAVIGKLGAPNKKRLNALGITDEK